MSFIKTDEPACISGHKRLVCTITPLINGKDVSVPKAEI